VTGTVVSEPDPGAISTSYELRLDEARGQWDGFVRDAGVVRVTLHQYAAFLPGDRLRSPGRSTPRRCSMDSITGPTAGNGASGPPCSSAVRAVGRRRPRLRTGHCASATCARPVAPEVAPGAGSVTRCRHRLGPRPGTSRRRARKPSTALACDTWLPSRVERQPGKRPSRSHLPYPSSDAAAHGYLPRSPSASTCWRQGFRQAW